MKKILVLAAASILVSAPASAQQMNAETFYQRALKLQKKGVLALLSKKEIRALSAEGKAAGEASKRMREADIKAGRNPRYCPPKGPQSMNSDEFMKRLAAIPAAERKRIDMTEVMNRIFANKFPCR